MDLRRTTVGPLNLSSVHSYANKPFLNQSAIEPSPNNTFDSGKPPRISIGANTTGINSKRISFGVNSRKSIGAGSNKQSSGINRSYDPRNIGEKQFLNSSIRSLIEYLTFHNYEHPISPKILTKPTNKDFNNIVLFLFKQLDPNFKCVGKFEDEMLTIFKFLGYPFSISKSNISAVGSPHAWPTLLACIMWLIELLNYNQEADIAESRGEEILNIDDPNSLEKAFYKYLGRAYGLFLAAKDDQYFLLEEQFTASFDHKNELLKDQIDSIESRNQSMIHEIDEIKKRSGYITDLTNRKKELSNELQKQNSQLQQLQAVLDQQSMKNESRRSEFDRLHGINQTIHKEIEILKDRLSKQELSTEDVANMITERERLAEATKIASENRQGLQRKIWELEMALRDKVQSLEDTVKAYHSIAEDLKLIPQTARNSRGVELSIEVDIRAKKPDQLLLTDIRGMIVPVLTDIRRELSERTLTRRSHIIELQDETDEIETRKHELFEAREMYETKLRRAEATYRREKELFDQSIELQSKEVDSMEGRLTGSKDIATEEVRVTAASRRIMEAKAIRQARQTEHNRRKLNMIQSIMEVASLCTTHRETVQNQLDRLKTEYHRRLDAFVDHQPDGMETIFMPSNGFASRFTLHSPSTAAAIVSPDREEDGRSTVDHIKDMVALMTATKAQQVILQQSSVMGLANVAEDMQSTYTLPTQFPHRPSHEEDDFSFAVLNPSKNSESLIRTESQLFEVGGNLSPIHAIQKGDKYTNNDLYLLNDENQSRFVNQIVQPSPMRLSSAVVKGQNSLRAPPTNRNLAGLINQCAIYDKQLLDDSQCCDG